MRWCKTCFKACSQSLSLLAFDHCMQYKKQGKVYDAVSPMISQHVNISAIMIRIANYYTHEGCASCSYSTFSWHAIVSFQVTQPANIELIPYRSCSCRYAQEMYSKLNILQFTFYNLIGAANSHTTEVNTFHS